MKNATIKTALELGFDFENSTFENREELEREVIEFLSEKSHLLPVMEDECEVHGHGNSQYVNYGDYSSAGQIIDYGADYWVKEIGTKVFHSEFLYIDKDGNCFSMNLYQVVGATSLNAPEGFYYNEKTKQHEPEIIEQEIQEEE